MLRCFAERTLKRKSVMKAIAGIPAYNKQYPVCGVIHAAEEYVNEVIVVDDGSTDNTSKLAKRTRARPQRFKH